MSTIISGKVVRGKNKGKELGFPTANIELADKMPSGVYSGRIKISDKTYKAGIFVNNEGTLLEAHIIGFSGDLYGKEIEIEIGEKVRDILKFENDEALKKQIKEDIKYILANERANGKRIGANSDLVYPELSYKIVGLAMDIHNKLGNIYQEKHYQKVFEEKLKQLKIPYEREKKIIARTDDGCEIGEFFADFIVDNKILLEFKRVNFIHYNDIKQVLRYLDVTNLKLGIIVNFKLNKLQYRRIINPHVSSY